MSQFKALNKKNWILWKRNICGNISQIIIPLLFITFLFIIRNLIVVNQYTEQQLLLNPTYSKTIYGQPTTNLTISDLLLKQCPPKSIVGLSPPNNSLIKQIKIKLNALNFIIKQYDSDQKINQDIRSLDYGINIPRFCFAISVVESIKGQSYKYKLRFNQTMTIQRTQGPGTNLPLQLDQAIQLDIYKRVSKKGMLGTTTFVNNIILQTQTDNAQHILKNNISPIYQQYYQKDGLYENMKTNIAMIFLLPLLVLYLRLTSVMLSQKQKKIRQTMSIMGMKIKLYYLTWFIRYFIVFLFIHLIGSGIVTVVFPYIPYYIPLIIFLLFDILLIIQSFFIQVFFSRSKIGVVIALLFFLIQYILSFISSNSDNPTYNVNLGLTLVPHVAFVLAFQTIVYAQSIKRTLTFNQMTGNYTIATAIVGLICNIIFWSVLTLYLEQVFPNQFGSKKHPLFCFFNKNNKKSNKQNQDDQIQHQPQIEQVQQKYKVQQKQNQIINIQNLTKQFNNGDFIAVKNLNIKMYNDNIFVLLGHNGAGKTTTISMLTGLLQSTSGIIQVLGETKMSKIREKLGICPQHDTLYDDLTVKQHLELFGNFRGLSQKDLQTEVDKLISDVNLSQKRQQYSKNLSGGQKRRLSVAMAFAGRSKVIILDQPTSGMDTSNRRFIWQLLKGYKNDRIILLTTHFMDQADYLGDRIGIMAGGKIICCGSAHYLKNKFGVGYNITFVKKNSQTSTNQIIKIVQKHIQKCILLSDVSSQITIQLPMNQIKKFPALFDQIDSKMSQLFISTYGISITTLQEVFLKVGQETQKLQDLNKSYSNAKSHQKSQKIIQQRKNIDLNKEQQLITDRKFIQNNLRKTQQQFQKTINQNIYRIQSIYHRFILHLWATLLKRLRVIKRDYKSFILQLILPMGIIILALLLMRISFIKDFPERQLTLNTYNTVANPLQIQIGSNNSTFLNQIQSTINSKYNNKLLIDKDASQNSIINFDRNFLRSKKKEISFFMGGIYFNSQSTQNNDSIYEATTIVDTKVPTSCIYLQTLAAETYLNKITSQKVSISIVQSPFPRTYDQLQMNNTISGIFGALIFSIALAFKFASIISFIVKQRQDKSKHQQIISGMNIYAYWIGNFIYDYFLYLVLAGFSIIMCNVLNAKAFITGQAFNVLITAFILYGLAYIPLTYIFSYLFKDYGNAQAGFYFLTFVLGGLLSLVVFLLRFLGGNAGKVGLGISWLFRIIPSYSFGQILVNIGSINLLGLKQLNNQSDNYSPWAINISMAPIIFLAGEFIIYTFIVFILQAVFNNENIMRYLTSEASIEQTKQIFDSDVLQMKQRALKARPQAYQILTKNLRKVYLLDSDKKYKVGVDNISLAIQKGQVFGLLGVNGAGKTTTFKMLAGQITSTSGDSYFAGMKISQNLHLVRQNLGYCPQFDALIQNLTVKEQIQLFYDLKSLPSQFKEKIISQKIIQMDLKKYQHKLSGTLSGGNKRKLSVAMAMIGNPNIIFLDQPSTGMDPKARRFMWKIISRIASQKKESTIILTTHSMQQAQALSTKMAIMVDGQFKCYGTTQHIKSKYGQGYELQIKLTPCQKQQINNYLNLNKVQNKQNIHLGELDQFLTYLNVDQSFKKQISNNGKGNYIYNQLQTNKKIETFQIIQFILLTIKINNIKRWMQNRFGQIQVIQNFQTFIRFKVKANLSIGKMFKLLQNQKQNINVESYSIKQATVQQIFNKFALNGQHSELKV